MPALDHFWAYMTAVSNVRSDRFSDIVFTGPRVRLWLQAVVRHIVISVGFTFSSGHADAEFPHLVVDRTHLVYR